MTQDYNVSVSMNQAAVIKTGLVLKQGDFGFNLKITVLDFDVTGTTPQIVFRKPMGSVESTSVTKSGNVYTYVMRGTELDTPGKVICDLKLKNSTTQRISSASFQFECVADTLDGLTEEASSYSDSIENLTKKLTTEFNEVTWADPDFVDLSQVTITEGAYIKSDGTIENNSALSYTDYVEIQPGWDKIVGNRMITLDGGADYPQAAIVAFYDSSKTFIARPSGTVSGDLLTTTIPQSNAKYFRMNLSRSNRPQVAAIIKNKALRYLTHISDDNQSLNTLTDAGIYLIPSTNTHLPVEENIVGACFLLVMATPYGAISQVLFTIGPDASHLNRNPLVVTRSRTNGGTWTPWTQLTGMQGYGIDLSSSGQSVITDLNDLPINYIYSLFSNSEISNRPYIGWLGTVICFHGKGFSGPGRCQLAFSHNYQVHFRRSWGANDTWGDWMEIETKNSVKSTLGLVGEYHGQFPSSATIVDTQITLQPNTTYIIQFKYPRKGNINVFGLGNTSNYKVVWTAYNEVRFTNDDTARYLQLNNNQATPDKIDVYVYTEESYAYSKSIAPKTYRVSKMGETYGDYTSLTQCLIDLKDDDSPKIIEIYEGDYDIYQEYVDANVPVYTGDNPSMDYFDYCVWIPKNTHIIGKGIVRLKWMPNTTDNPEITWQQCSTVSPVNVAATMTLENVEIHCKNGRYCIHNDGLGKPEFNGAIQKYINVKCYKYQNEYDEVAGKSYGFNPCTGFGIDRDMHHIYEGCQFFNYTSGRAFYGHSRATANPNENSSSNITLSNCIMDATNTNDCVKLGGSAATTPHIRVDFNNCYFSGRVNAVPESSSTENPRNAYDVTFLDCGDVTMHIEDGTENRYPPKAYRTNLTLV